MVLDASKPDFHRDILTRELESVGIRLNRTPPNIYFKKKKTGGISFNAVVPLTHLDEKMCQRILQVHMLCPCTCICTMSERTLSGMCFPITRQVQCIPCPINAVCMCCRASIVAVQPLSLRALPINAHARCKMAISSEY